MQVPGQNILKFGLRANLHDALIELIRRSKSFRVPRRDLSKHAATVFLPENFYHQIQVAAHDSYALFKSRFSQQFSRVEIVQRVLEYPRIVKRSSPDAHTRAARLIEHPLSSFGRC